MTDETTSEVTENSEGTPAATPDPAQDAPRTEATDTTPPEEKVEAPTEAPVEAPAAEETEVPKEEHKSKARRKPATKPKATEPEKDWEYQKPNPSITTRIQRALGRHGFYYGPADGRFESKSVQGVQKAISHVGFQGVANGHIGEEQARLIQVFAKQVGNYTGPINKKIDDNTWAGFAVGLERLK